MLPDAAEGIGVSDHEDQVGNAQSLREDLLDLRGQPLRRGEEHGGVFRPEDAEGQADAPDRRNPG